MGWNQLWKSPFVCMRLPLLIRGCQFDNFLIQGCCSFANLKRQLLEMCTIRPVLLVSTGWYVKNCKIEVGIPVSASWHPLIVIKVSQSQKAFISSENEPNNYPEHYPPKEKMLKIVIWNIFWKMEPNEKLSEIKPPLLQQ